VPSACGLIVLRRVYCSSGPVSSGPRPCIADIIFSCCRAYCIALACHLMSERPALQCAVCLEQFDADVPARQPRLLACAHSFCTDCVGRLLVKQGSITYVPLMACYIKSEPDRPSWNVALACTIMSSIQSCAHTAHVTIHLLCLLYSCPNCRQLTPCAPGSASSLKINFALVEQLQLTSPRPPAHSAPANSAQAAGSSKNGRCANCGKKRGCVLLNLMTSGRVPNRSAANI